MGAVITPTIKSGVMTEFSLTNAGSGHTSAPISSTPGVGAALTFSLLQSCTITTGITIQMESNIHQLLYLYFQKVLKRVSATPTINA